MSRNTIRSTLAVVALVGASLFAAAPAYAATPGMCQSLAQVSVSGTTVHVKNPCGNLSGRYSLYAYGPNGTTTYSATVTLPPLGRTSFTKGPNGYGVVTR